MDTLTGNKLIAEFCGYKFVTIDYYDTPDETQWQRENEKWMESVGLYDVGDYFVNVPENKFFEADEIQYHSSWDWLMPVVEKLESLRIAFTVDPWSTEAIEYISGEEKEVFHFINDDNYPKITQYYETVIGAIQWYNTQSGQPGK